MVSIFVNPSQFGPREDFKQYPRTLDADLDALAACGESLVFAPADDEVYPAGFDTWVEVGSVAAAAGGQVPAGPLPRRGHGRAEAVQHGRPDVAYFGQKDYQQAVVIRRMVEDLNVPVEIRVCPTVREPDGLAMSSRNAYLSPGRAAAGRGALQEPRAGRRHGRRGPARRGTTIADEMRAVILSADRRENRLRRPGRPRDAGAGRPRRPADAGRWWRSTSKARG